jgi:hypothetical protein
MNCLAAALSFPSFFQGGLVREKLWDLLGNEHDIVMEEGFPNATGCEQSVKGMRSSEFCLHPAGDTQLHVVSLMLLPVFAYQALSAMRVNFLSKG